MKIVRWMVCVCVSLLIAACSNNKTKQISETAADTLPPDENIHHGIVQLERSHVNDTVTWRGKVYHYDIVREPDPSLPKVKDDQSGSTFSDNHINLTITCNGKQIFQKRFQKTSFSSFLDSGFRQKGMLEGLVFDTTVPEGLRFATSICYPRSDLYIPLVIIINSEGKMSVQKDQILDASESEEDGEGN